MAGFEPFAVEHLAVTRRFFLRLAAGGSLGLGLGGGVRGAWAFAEPAAAASGAPPGELPPECAKACEAFLKKMEYLTAQEAFGNVSRGTPKPHDLPEEKRREVGLTPETWRLEIVSDPEHPADIERPLTKEAGTAFTWDALLKLAETRGVSFAKIMTCNNGARPLGMGVWEGVPLRDVLWLTGPKQNLRRVFYYGYHNDDPKQMFRSSLPIGRVLEDSFDLPPVILCYKLNGQWLNPHRGGPVRLVVPETYGFKSIKWLARIVLTNLPHANDTYADGNNDLDSLLKTFARSFLKPDVIRAGEPIPLTGYAQVGVSGLKGVQTLLWPKDQAPPASDPYFTQAAWSDAHLLPPPERWGGKLPEDALPPRLHGFDAATGRPRAWPMRLTLAHWATVLPGLPAGAYTLRCRTIDAAGHAQPLPRPFAKSGRNAIEEVALTVVD